MSKIIACIDGSTYADSICRLSAWAAKQTGMRVCLLHIAAPHTEMKAKVDLSGSIGLGAKSSLLKELTKIDEEHGKLEQHKGVEILERAKKVLAENGIEQPEILHRRGSLVETIAEIGDQAELIVVGKGGEQDNAKAGYVGAHLDRLAHATHKSLLIATKETREVKRFLIAYDGSPSSNKAIEYVSSQLLFEDLECHILCVTEKTPGAERSLAYAENKIKESGIQVIAHLHHEEAVAVAVTDYIKEHDIDLLSMGAYGHSKMHSLFFGSTTKELIQTSQVPILLFRG
ncbi:MAG: universal stress protein UspA [Verrucomicrobia bacterium CG_4_10_14_3_um_filter_43_23]|nr:MAG: hypothetical protein AUJ82_05430 [Verrucomicrobia bacterium CG1_02_43_26]PIP58768.1 MAG: universal stress protein UspA [Verrucomicrobia bacterium CG22_combo_CG10-13_8_21_14_all_43_17]PIX57615.1 MAG: universal stress protein UspA [Verrucomicrobia bacterium CG_4_10_14_3_um_filter_43_23]PIY61522.1 MAG: universal stress protein UspA [Verrucomicrobia bacterium CG_4_10_14_0_8_um_filter_43_34]PJA44411.1 MAG: universal stress protein UspA [Verrucomicrobia bacterium CG_4_9_14_3_um_filter_43_20]